MKLNKPKFWSSKKNFFSLTLIPLSFLTKFIIWIKNKTIKQINYNIPIICVGNIYIGGTGKTPFSIYLAKELLKNKKNPVIIRKFYSDHVDEHSLIKNQFNNLILNKSRDNAILEAINKNFDVAVLDDGFQDKKIFKNINIICFNKNQLVGNGLVIPAGPLREDLNSLRDVKFAIINGGKTEEFENKILSFNKRISIFYSKYEPINIERFYGKKIIAIAGIGNPSNFFEILTEYKLNVIQKLEFPDHYEFSKSELISIIEKNKKEDCQIIMTEKDYFRIKKYNLPEIEYLKVDLKIFQKEELIKKILENL